MCVVPDQHSLPASLVATLPAGLRCSCCEAVPALHRDSCSAEITAGFSPARPAAELQTADRFSPQQPQPAGGGPQWCRAAGSIASPSLARPACSTHCSTLYCRAAPPRLPSLLSMLCGVQRCTAGRTAPPHRPATTARHTEPVPGLGPASWPNRFIRKSSPQI